MKILRVITRLNVGGPARQAIDLNHELQKRGHEVRLVTGICPKHEGNFLEDEAEKTFDHFSFRYTPYLQREINIQQDWLAYKFLRNVIMYYKPDILHTHMSKAGTLARFAALSVQPRPKLVHTFHGHTFHSYFGKCKGWLFLQIERWLAKRTDAIIAISHSQKEELGGYGLKPKRMVVIPLGFDLDRFLELPMWEENLWVKKKDFFHVGIVGRLTKIKNHELFFKFIGSLQQELSQYKINSIVIGDGERRKELKSKHKAWFTGWRNPKEMVDWYRYLDLVVCTSKNEGTPVSLIEAMAAGRPVVSTPVGGVVDLLGQCGERGMYLYNPISTTQALRVSLEDGSYKQRIESARRYVKERHSLDRLVDNIENLYKELCGNGKGEC